MQSKIVLAYQLPKTKEKAVQEICKKQNVRYKAVARNLYHQPLGFLAGIAGIKKNAVVYEGDGLAEEMLLFCGFTSEALDEFLAAYKETGMNPVALKAIVTPHNIFWDSVQLFEELQKERHSIG